jgi:hypothetical protein
MVKVKEESDERANKILQIRTLSQSCGIKKQQSIESENIFENLP